MGRNRVEKSVIYVGEGDVYERDFRNGEKIVLKTGIVTPVSDDVFAVLKDARNIHEVVGQSYDIPKNKDFKEEIIKE